MNVRPYLTGNNCEKTENNCKVLARMSRFCIHISSYFFYWESSVSCYEATKTSITLNNFNMFFFFYLFSFFFFKEIETVFYYDIVSRTRFLVTYIFSMILFHLASIKSDYETSLVVCLKTSGMFEYWSATYSREEESDVKCFAKTLSGKN